MVAMRALFVCASVLALAFAPVWGCNSITMSSTSKASAAAIRVANSAVRLVGVIRRPHGLDVICRYGSRYHYPWRFYHVLASGNMQRAGPCSFREEYMTGDHSRVIQRFDSSEGSRAWHAPAAQL